jgi:hypothetical protein
LSSLQAKQIEQKNGVATNARSTPAINKLYKTPVTISIFIFPFYVVVR